MAGAGASPASAQQSDALPLQSHYGGVGLLRTRSARMLPDSTLSTTVSVSEAQQRYALTFQAAPWLETTFSYSGFELEGGPDNFFDRQFDIKIRLWEESLYIPQIAIGLQDFLGTGVFSGEYLVASKRIGPLDLSLGLGWGRLGSRGVVSNPLSRIDDRFGSRGGFSGVGGEVNFGQFFRGEEVGVFGGVVWDTPIDGLRVIAEYDSDRNDRVVRLDDNPFNFGLSYSPAPGIQLGASYIAQDEVYLTASFGTVTKEAVLDEPPGQPAPAFYVRADESDAGGGPDRLVAPIQPPLFTPVPRAELGETLAEALRAEGLDLIRMQVGTDALRVVIRNGAYRPFPKAVGRTVRVLSRFAPMDVDTFQVVIDQRGLEAAEFLFDRAGLEASARESGYSLSPPFLEYAYITPGSRPVTGTEIGFVEYPDFTYRIGPDIRYNTFDPNDPLRLQLTAEAEGSVELTRGLHVAGTVAVPVFDILGDFDDVRTNTSSALPQVRTNFGRYNRDTTVGVYQLYSQYLFSPYPNVYAQLTGGLLEQMFGGVGGELLWRPPGSRLAWGAELFYARQRDFDTLFTFQDYDVITGHASVYWDTPYNDWNVAVHAGRYLAKDLGATFEVKRRFPNGWEVGAFATFTDVPFDTFGEGSFDKGITLTIPLDWGLARDTQLRSNLLIRPIQRDGGARLFVPNRLFGRLQPVTRGEVAAQWNTFAH